MLNCLAAAIPGSERVVSCEEVFELDEQHPYRRSGCPDTPHERNAMPLHPVSGMCERLSPARSRSRFPRVVVAWFVGCAAGDGLFVCVRAVRA